MVLAFVQSPPAVTGSLFPINYIFFNSFVNRQKRRRNCHICKDFCEISKQRLLLLLLTTMSTLLSPPPEKNSFLRERVHRKLQSNWRNVRGHLDLLSCLLISAKRCTTSSSVLVLNTSITTFRLVLSHRPLSASSSIAPRRCCPSTMPKVYAWFCSVICRDRGKYQSGNILRI